MLFVFVFIAQFVKLYFLQSAVEPSYNQANEAIRIASS